MGPKLKLDLDELQVESFDTAADEQGRRGTVRGNDLCTCNCCETDACTAQTACGQATCAVSCNGTCNEWTCGDCYGTVVDATCNGYGTCGVYPCKAIP